MKNTVCAVLLLVPLASLADIQIRYKDGIEGIIYRDGENVKQERCPRDVLARRRCTKLPLNTTSYSDYVARIVSFFRVAEKAYATPAGMQRVSQKLDALGKFLSRQDIRPEERNPALQQHARFLSIQKRWLAARERFFSYLEKDNLLELEEEYQSRRIQIFELAFLNMWFLDQFAFEKLPTLRTGTVNRVFKSTWMEVKKGVCKNGDFNWSYARSSSWDEFYLRLQGAGLIENDYIWTNIDWMTGNDPRMPPSHRLKTRVCYVGMDPEKHKIGYLWSEIPKKGGPEYVAVCSLPFEAELLEAP